MHHGWTTAMQIPSSYLEQPCLRQVYHGHLVSGLDLVKATRNSNLFKFLACLFNLSTATCSEPIVIVPFFPILPRRVETITLDMMNSTDKC